MMTVLEVKSLSKPGWHAVGGATGLYVQIAPHGGKNYVFRYQINGKRRNMGLGGVDSISLADARKLATEKGLQAREGIDPINTRHEKRVATSAASAKRKTFKECALACIDSKSAAWAGSRTESQWTRCFEQYAFPIIGDMPVHKIELAHVLEALEPIWRTKHQTALALRRRIEAVLDWAKPRGYRAGENPAMWRGNLKHVLPSGKKVAREKHHAALDADDIPEFMARLRALDSVPARALELAVLTALRSNEVLGARWDEFDMEKRVWTIPGDRMKMQEAHRVPLSGAAMAILEKMAACRQNDLVFPGAYRDGNGRREHNCMRRVLARMGYAVTVHGYRSTFSDWVGEETDFPEWLAEMALAHLVGNAVQRAYRRKDAFEKRRKLMEAWARYCDGETEANVLQLAA